MLLRYYERLLIRSLVMVVTPVNQYPATAPILVFEANLGY